METEWAPESQDPIAHLRVVGIGQAQIGNVGSLDLENCQVSLRIGPDDPGVQDTAAVELDIDPARLLDNVVIGQHQTLRIDDEARAKARLLVAPRRPAQPEELLEGIRDPPDHLLGVDVDHCRLHAFRDVGERTAEIRRRNQAGRRRHRYRRRGAPASLYSGVETQRSRNCQKRNEDTGCQSSAESRLRRPKLPESTFKSKHVRHS